MARSYANERDYDERVIREEIERHERAYQLAQDRYGYAVTNSGEKTMRKHDILANALDSYLRSRRHRIATRTKLSDIQDVVNANLKRMDEGWKDMNIRSILEQIKLIAQREE